MSEIGLDLLSFFRSDNILISMIFVAFSIAIVLTPPQKNKKSLIRFCLQCACIYLVLIASSALVRVLIFWKDFPIYHMFSWNFLSELVVICLYAILFCHYAPLIRLTMAGSLAAAVLICTDLSHYLGHLASEISPYTTIPVLLLTYGLLAAFAIFEARKSLDHVTEFPRFGAVLISVINLLTITMAFLTQTLDTAFMTPSVYSMIVYAILLILTFTSYLSLYHICIEHEETARLKMENSIMRIGAEQVTLANQNLSDLRKIRHDLRNSYTYMSGLLKNGSYQELEQVIDSFNPDRLTPSFYVDCGNSTINAILTAESSKAHAKGIRLQTTLTVPPKLPFKTADLFSVLSNLIGNAVEADLRFGIQDDVLVQISLKEQYLYICVRNSLPASVDRAAVLKLQTSKKHPEEHGLGTKIVQRIAEKYNGYFLTDIDGRQFIAEVLLDMMYEKNDGKNR